MLKNVFKLHPYICGVDLDIEENVNLNDVIKLVNILKTDFGNEFLIHLLLLLLPYKKIEQEWVDFYIMI